MYAFRTAVTHMDSDRSYHRKWCSHLPKTVSSRNVIEYCNLSVHVVLGKIAIDSLHNNAELILIKSIEH
jgi:hypothetical protein